MKFGLNSPEAIVLREALMTYRDRLASLEWREPSDSFRIAAADDLLGRLNAHGRLVWVELDDRANIPVKADA